MGNSTAEAAQSDGTNHHLGRNRRSDRKQGEQRGHCQHYGVGVLKGPCQGKGDTSEGGDEYITKENQTQTGKGGADGGGSTPRGR